MESYSTDFSYLIPSYFMDLYGIIIVYNILKVKFNLIFLQKINIIFENIHI